MIWMAGPRSKDRDHFERPILQAAFLPWRGSNEFRRDLLRYNNMVAMLLITRDSTSGTVKGDPYRPDALYVDYTINKFDRNALCKLC